MEVLKWKPPDMNSVDFKLQVVKEEKPGYGLCTICRPMYRTCSHDVNIIHSFRGDESYTMVAIQYNDIYSVR